MSKYSEERVGQLRPMCATRVHPSEYDIDGDIKDAIRISNNEGEIYVPMDIGKIAGLYSAYLELKNRKE